MIPNTPTIGDCVKFIAQHNILKEWKEHEIGAEIKRSIQEGGFAYDMDSNTKQLKGLVVARWHDSCSLHVVAICGVKGSIRKFLQHLKHVHPHVKKLSAYRRGTYTEYNLK